MKKSFGDYRLLAKGNRLAGSLWQGPDHLLEIEQAGFLMSFTETYRRIDYKNIQAISYARTRRGMWISILGFVALGILALSIGISIREENHAIAIILAVLAAVVLTFLIIHLVRGPTCVCMIQTAVQCRRLRPLDRLRKAERFARQVGQLCIANQGGPTLAAGPPAAGVPDTASTNGIDFQQPWTGSRLVTWALVLLVFSGGVTIADAFIKGMLFLTLDLLLGIAAYVLVVAGLARSARLELPVALKTALWGAAGSFVLSIVTGYGLIIWASMETTTRAIERGDAPKFGNANEAAYRYLANAGPEELGWVIWLFIGLGTAASFFGLLGLPSALRPAAKVSAPVPPPLSGIQPSTSEIQR